MKKETYPITIASVITVLFLIFVLSSGAFNILPDTIYKFIRPDLSGESVFIIAFDILFALLLFTLVYVIMNKLWE
jgi:hypothetical protein